MQDGGHFQANLQQQILNLKSRPYIITQGNCQGGFVVNESCSASVVPEFIWIPVQLCLVGTSVLNQTNGLEVP